MGLSPRRDSIFAAFYQRVALPGTKSAGLSLQPLADIHFNAAYHDPYSRQAHKPTLFALAGIALFILVIAAINFINLSTAQSILRAKEVGIRKVMGSSVSGIVWQFLIETGILVVTAMTLALLLAGPVIAALHGFIPEGVQLHMTDEYLALYRDYDPGQLSDRRLVSRAGTRFFPARIQP